MRPLDLLYAAALPVAYLAWARRGKHRTDWPARMGRGASLQGKTRRRVLVHGVSVGEVGAMRMLVEALQALDAEVVVAATTDTGLARARQLYEAQGITVVRYPFDLSCAVDRFLDRVQPDVVVSMELEVWPHMTLECEARGIPFVVVNGRLSERSFKGYRRLRPILRPMFSRISQVMTQNETYAGRFRWMGARQISVAGSMKWDTAKIEPSDTVAGAADLAVALGIDRHQPLVVAGSTGPGEEALLVAALKEWPAGTQLLLAPRKPERFDDAHAVCPSGTPRRTRCPDGTATPSGSSVFLLDTLGELRKAYALADVVLVGRSFLGLHGSDVFEPVGLGKPTIIGPHYGDFSDAVEALRSAGGLVVSGEPGAAAARLLGNKVDAAAMAARGQDVIRAHQGASARQAAAVMAVLAANRVEKNLHGKP